jgi:hypothetical protein
MSRRVPLLLALSVACAVVLHAAPEPTPPIPQGIAVSHEKTTSLALPREKTPGSGHGEDRIWSGLVCATNAATPKDPPPELREFAPRLRRIFGYNQFELVGSASNVIDEVGESWLVPSKHFWLGVRARPAAAKEARGGYLLNLQLFQDQRPLVDTEAKLAPASPLFIRGPQYGKGQLIIVLQIQR